MIYVWLKQECQKFAHIDWLPPNLSEFGEVSCIEMISK